jgi:ABC-type transport system involved in multi-copper enzyme maturation permease subunit
MVGNRWTIGLLLWVFPLGVIAFVLGMSLIAFVNPAVRENMNIATWKEAFLPPWSFVNNPFGAMLLLALISVTFAGEYQWGTWKNILPRQYRNRIIMAKFINLAGLIFLTFMLTSFIFGVGLGILAAISGNTYISEMTGKIAQGFLIQ